MGGKASSQVRRSRNRLIDPAHKYWVPHPRRVFVFAPGVGSGCHSLRAGSIGHESTHRRKPATRATYASPSRKTGVKERPLASARNAGVRTIARRSPSSRISTRVYSCQKSPTHFREIKSAAKPRPNPALIKRQPEQPKIGCHPEQPILAVILSESRRAGTSRRTCICLTSL
jgi:hypothetical protein